MKSCNAQASGKQLKGDDRQAFMSRCLKGEGEEEQLTAQQEKMKTCNAQASKQELKGDERRVADMPVERPQAAVRHHAVRLPQRGYYPSLGSGGQFPFFGWFR